MRDTVVVIFRFDNSDWMIWRKVEHIVRPLRLLTHDKIALQIDLSICELGFHRDLSNIPFSCYGRCDEMQLDIFF